MARMNIPTIKTKAPEVEQAGPVVVGGEDAAVGPAPAGVVETDDLTELGVLQPAAVEQTVQTAQQPYAPLPPAQANDNVARAEELARSIVEVRAIAVEAQNGVRNLMQQAQNLAGEVSLLRDMWNAGIKLPADISALPQKLADLAQSLSLRVNNIDASLASRGLPTSQSAPTIKLTQMRRIVYPAKVVDGAVVLFYNPRQGENGAHDPQDFQLNQNNARRVWSGYRIEIPDGYIADIFVGSDMIASLSGRRDSEEVLNLRTNGASWTVASGHVVARLLLRKVEPAALQVEVMK
jgi:hypothetical protein